jgi:hypothetical protein
MTVKSSTFPGIIREPEEKQLLDCMGLAGETVGL